MNWTMGASETDLLDGIVGPREPVGTGHPARRQGHGAGTRGGDGAGQGRGSGASGCRGNGEPVRGGGAGAPPRGAGGG